MTVCERLRPEAPGLAALPPEDPERVAAWTHANGCAGCARALREAERLQTLVAAWEAPPLAAGALERASQTILTDLRREARRRLWASIAAVCASLLAFVAFARPHSRSAEDWALAAFLGALAIALAAGARQKARFVIAAAVVAAVAAAIAFGRPGPLAPATGLHCLATEVASAAMVVGAVWLAIRGGATSPARSAMAAAAAAGALAGYAALQITCGAHEALPHLLPFHVGGLVLAMAGMSLLWGAGRRMAV